MASSFRIVLDTNIVVSGLISPGVSRDFIFRLLCERKDIVLSDYIYSEVEEVLTRHKIHTETIIDELWQRIRTETVYVRVPLIFQDNEGELRDPKDHPILQTAIKGDAWGIVTGDKDLLVLKIWKGITILRMKDFPWG